MAAIVAGVSGGHGGQKGEDGAELEKTGGEGTFHVSGSKQNTGHEVSCFYEPPRPLKFEQLFGKERGLEGGNLLDALLGEGDQALELFVSVGGLFAGTLDFDEFTLAGHDDVEVDLGVLVFDVGQVEEFAAVEESDADGGDTVDERVFGDASGIKEGLNGKTGGEVGAGDGRSAGAAVGLEDVAVDPKGVFAELAEVEHGAQGTTDEALDFDGAAIEFAARDVALFALVRAVREEGVFGREPTAGNALLFHPRRHLGLDGGGADDAGVAVGDEHRTGGVGRDAGFEGDGAELVGFAAVGAGSGGRHKTETIASREDPPPQQNP
jgi:hypothetical protein